MRLLATALLARSVIHGVFAFWLLYERPEWANVFQTGAVFALVDGSLAIGTAVFLAWFPVADSPPLLSPVTLADGFGRLATGIALRTFPGLSGFVVPVVTLFGVVGIWTTALGVVAAIGWIRVRLRASRGWPISVKELFDPLAAAAILSFIAGYVLIQDPPTTAGALRILSADAAAVLSLVFGAAGLRAIFASRRVGVSI